MSETCPVTVYNRPRIRTGGGARTRLATCDEPVVRDGLCKRHLADRERLGGDAA